ncbi:MAG: DegT/DnrJ/EryC1/StrS family aminotransferase [Candidatus Eremiobacteraeota bacterium]|nr:DegT/DnrJ/EryC1/StrS family aminotransferase [Candidatus Eremiobacteraeota bacterium]
MIPICDLTRQHHQLRPVLERAFAEVLDRGSFINGPNVAAFEEELAAYLRAPHAVGLNSGTDALHLALRALDIGPGDEVITTPFTFVATTEAIAMVGATPVFADIDPATFAIDPAAVTAAVTPRTRAIIPVHLYGLPTPMEEICRVAQRHHLAIVEDCAQSIGATIDGNCTGTIGTIGALSFFPSKNLGACGDAGAIVTKDAALAERVRRLRAHGAAVKYYHDELGANSRLDELQAAILRVKLRHLEQWIERRRAIAAWYTVALGRFGIATPSEPRAPSVRHVYHQFTVRIAQERDRVAGAMRENGVATMVYYPVPLHLQHVHSSLGLREGAFPEAERAAREVLSLPMFPELRDTEVDRVVSAMEAALTPEPV